MVTVNTAKLTDLLIFCASNVALSLPINDPVEYAELALTATKPLFIPINSVTIPRKFSGLH